VLETFEVESAWRDNLNRRAFGGLHDRAYHRPTAQDACIPFLGGWNFPRRASLWVMGKSFLWPASWVHWLALVPGALGLAILLRCMWDFVAVGLGTPAPIDPPKTLVATGLYQFVRNPMYVGVMIAVLSEAAFFGSLRVLEYAVVIWAMVFLFVLGYEEPTLRRKFGASYEVYCKGVPRWIPRLTPWQGEP
jgi:protein-S-isoprenylcysteine O-methyltransferase Ste14